MIHYQDINLGKKDRNSKQLKISEFDLSLDKKHIVKVMQSLDLSHPRAVKCLYSYQGILRYLDVQKVCLQAKYEGNI